MDSHNLRIWALIQQDLVIVEAMKAENESRKDRGLAQAYGVDEFMLRADSIGNYATAFREDTP